MDRRRFLKTALAAPASLAIPEGYAALLDEKPKRVGIIGPGWYGKIDLIRLLQVAPVGTARAICGGCSRWHPWKWFPFAIRISIN